MSVTVLITAAGSPGALDVIDALRARERYRVVAIDTSPYATGFARAHVSHVVPPADAPAYPDSLRAILHAERPHFVLPFIDEELLPTHALAAEVGAQVLAPVPAFCRMALDKWLMCNRLAMAGIPVPPTRLLPDAEALSYPMILKPRVGRGGRGFAVAHHWSDVATYRCRVGVSDQLSVIAQEQLGEPEWTVSVVGALDGALLAIVPKRVVVKRGITQVGVTARDATVEDICVALHRGLQPHGPCNVQLMTDAAGQPRVIEVNARYSSTVALTLAAGLDEVDAVICHARGELDASLTFRPGVRMVRYMTQRYDTVETP